ncbi:MAG: tetratricopeptide repeat protein [Gammaproteobacteria bacterium]|nr:tetratricopeptide repeat protein [Gammaproteobacteria bacterium]
MDVYLSEEEQLRRIKEWWQKHGNMIMTVVVIVLAIMAGWRLWHRHEVKLARQASIVYAQMLNADFAKQQDDFRLYANRLTKDYSGTPYASLAELLLAKDYVQSGKIDEAMASLKWVISNGKVTSLVDIASIRLARLLISNSKNQQALKLLKGIKTQKFDAVKYELMGDAMQALGKKKAANENYERAIDAAKKANISTTLLRLKIT